VIPGCQILGLINQSLVISITAIREGWEKELVRPPSKNHEKALRVLFPASSDRIETDRM
jgi:hypothetical protein